MGQQRTESDMEADLWVPCPCTHGHAEQHAYAYVSMAPARFRFMVEIFTYPAATEPPPVRLPLAAAGRPRPALWRCSASLWARLALLLRRRFYAPAEEPASSAFLPAWYPARLCCRAVARI